MDHQNLYSNALECVENARKAIEESQGNNNPEEFQQAKQLLEYAHEMVQQSRQTDGLTEEQTKRLFHAREHLRHLQETTNAIEATRYE
ncbi:hypothetical protein M1K46_06420 [Fictibacillus sp. WQ 8-8]|uniref:DUF2564 family protein n=1 Tax=Fictibacillus marinisediminis TaxID=2878389 RepID=A0A9X1XAA8_9BACL|nr:MULTISPECIES: hypothetical protein [Fictibacillus]SFE01578.1 hypothetical protein SAMN05428981_103107 [Bacillus sp. OV194]MCK6256501.1 hypothetical protein [Fictibacillus marinisediminis]MCQ6265294.1 hypothetical protein [Fictibacillus sp. WQ 8-8]MED2971964.1 hypothetical protein [Fictibacillus sp. B-59209]UZJ77616.1 hypothetical protein OKX00_15735 [Fictibacillus sp. KU28468]